MNKKSEIVALVKQAMEALDVELRLHQSGRGTVSDPDELQYFKAHMEEILAQLENKIIAPKSAREFGMGHAIADSWPLDSKLGNLLCSAEQAYRDL